MATAKRATPEQWQTLFNNLATFVAQVTSGSTVAVKDLLTAIGNILDAVEALNNPVVTDNVYKLRAAMPTVENPTARDWAGFFSALASFATTVLPLITSFFATANATKDKDK